MALSKNASASVVDNVYGNTRIIEPDASQIENILPIREAAASQDALNAALTTAGYSDSKINRMTINDKVFALRTKKGLV